MNPALHMDPRARSWLVARLWTLIGSLITSIGCFAAPTTESEVRQSMRRDVKTLWEARDYKALDAMGTALLKANARSPSGLWKSSMFASSLMEQVDYEADDQTWDNRMEVEVLPWPKASPESPFARLLVAASLTNRAWKKRGAGWAKDVKPEAWKGFHKHLEQARHYLEATKTISSKEMTWYSMMAQLAVWQSWEESRLLALLAEGKARNRDYFPMYFSALDYYSPKWGGSAQKIESFVRGVVSDLPVRDGDMLYVRMYWWAADTHFERQLLDSEVDCDRMIRGMRLLAAKYPDPWNINRFASFAVDCGNKAAAREYFDKIGDKPELEVWAGSMRNFLQFRAIAYSKD